MRTVDQINRQAQRVAARGFKRLRVSREEAALWRIWLEGKSPFTREAGLIKMQPLDLIILQAHGVNLEWERSQ